MQERVRALCSYSVYLSREKFEQRFEEWVKLQWRVWREKDEKENN
jgi:hypothetical protein